MSNLVRTFEGRTYRKSTRSGKIGNCVFLPATGPLDAVADSKTGVVLRGDAWALVAFARTR